MSAFTKDTLATISKTMNLLPLVSDALGDIITEGSQGTVALAKGANKLFATGALYADDIYQDKLLLTDIKTDYREVVREECAAARKSGDKATILAALKQATIDLEESD